MLFQYTKFHLIGKLNDREKLVTQLKENGGILVDPDVLDDEKTQSFPTEVDKETVYVVDSFDGEIFEQLQNKRVRIIGSPCIYDSIRLNKSLPKVNYPVYNRIFEGFTITYTNKCEDVSKLIQYMNGKSESNICDSTNYLLSSEVTCNMYKMAVRKSISILQSFWVKKCWEQKTLFDPQRFLLPPFTGCVISATGFHIAMRNLIEKVTSLCGGIYSSSITPDCTHLIAYKAIGTKYKFAISERIKIVTSEWFFDSMKALVCCDEFQYQLVPSEVLGEIISPNWLSDILSETLSEDFETALNHINIIVKKLLNVNTVCQLLEKSISSKQIEVQKACYKFIAEHFQQVINTESYKNLPENIKLNLKRPMSMDIQTEQPSNILKRKRKTDL